MMLFNINRSFLFIAICCLFALNSTAQSVPQPKINEYSCSNTITLTDAFGNTPDWFELYNPSTTATMNLSGYYLSNDRYNLSMWQFPINTTVPPQGFITVYASGQDTFITAAGEYHTNFNMIQTKGQQFIVSDYSGVVRDSLTVKRTQRDHSWGRPNNAGSIWKLYSTPSPNTSNPTGPGTSFIDYKARPVFSLAAGSYGGSQSLTITCPQTAVKIKYTTNGADPNSTSALLYAGPISISSSTVVRAVCVDNPTLPATPSYLNSFIETNTYILPPYNTLTIPAVSVSVTDNITTIADTTTFFGGSTMDATFEYFEKNHQFVTETYGFAGPPNDEGGLFYKQKGFNYSTEDEYGYAYTNKHQFFDDPMLGASQRTDFTSLVFKSALQDNFPQGGSGTNGNLTPCHLRDAFSQSYAFRKNFKIDGRHYEPVIMFVNGKYWGIYDLHEAFDPEYTEYYHGQKDIMDLEYINPGYVNSPQPAWTTDWTNVYNYIMTNSMNVPANYAQADSMMDFSSFMDYMIWNTYAVNADFDQRNMEWRGTDLSKGSHKWTFSMFDMDNTWGLGNDPANLGNTSPTADLCNYQATYPSTLGADQGHFALLVKLMTNDTFKSAYINRWADLLNNSLSCDSLIEHFNYMRGLITPEMQKHYNRFAGSVPAASYYYSPPNDSLADWNRNLDLMKAFITRRCNFIDSTITDCYNVKGPYSFCLDVEPANMGTITFNSLKLSNFTYSGQYFGGVTMSAIATPVDNYYFDHWEPSGFTLVDSLIRQDTITWRYDSISCLKAVFRLKEPYNTVGEPLIPTGFSPNGDGNNDVLNIYGTRNVTKFELEIYNRWGQSVFKSNDKTVGWDGKFGGVDAPVGVYAYRFIATVDGTDVIKKGNVTLIR